MQSLRDLLVGITLEIRQVDQLPLLLFEFIDQFFQADIINSWSYTRMIQLSIQWNLFLPLLETLRTRFVDRCISCNVQHPREQAAFCFIIAVHPAPDIQKTFLQYIIAQFNIRHYLPDHAIQSGRIVIIQVGKCATIFLT